MNAGIVLFGSLLVFMLMDIPIALSLGLSSMVAVLVFGLAPLEFFPQIIFASADSFTLLAIPFFIFAGIVLGRTSIAQRLIDLAESVVGDFAGGLGIVGIAAAVFFAGISGSGPADVAALGLVLFSAMATAGYGRGFSSALIAASGGIGIIVPPSIALIIYGVIAEVSISKLFFAGIIPGFIVAASLSVVTWFISKRRGYGADESAVRLRERLPFPTALKRALFALFAPVLILGGIYGGVFTPTEAAAVAVVYSLAVDVFVYRSLDIADIPKIAGEAAVTSAVIMSIVITASMFAWILNTEGIARSLSDVLLSITSNRIILLLIMNGILIIAGLMLDAISIFYILLPILLPVVHEIGVDPVHFGIIMTVNLAIGQITPPVGVNLIASSGVTGVSLADVSRGAVPFLVAEAVALLIITYIPALSLALPSLF